MTIAAEPHAVRAVSSCARASEAAARCAAAYLGQQRLHDSGRCGEWCLVASRTLGACADLLGQSPNESHIEFVVALARAGVIAADECAIECGLHVDEVSECRAASHACRVAAVDLRRLIEDLEPLGTSHR